mmetsp:Transcript_35998/g.84042  ORF Transcript_35998/g.84042 Transcript_35998/m.84042 type:complete len:153 (-) Transcript_35998:393-851(-)
MSYPILINQQAFVASSVLVKFSTKSAIWRRCTTSRNIVSFQQEKAINPIQILVCKIGTRQKIVKYSVLKPHHVYYWKVIKLSFHRLLAGPPRERPPCTPFELAPAGAVAFFGPVPFAPAGFLPGRGSLQFNARSIFDMICPFGIACSKLLVN